jgi:hypothetical protein
MYEELIMRLLEDKSWIEQGTTETEHEIADHLQKAADAIEGLSGLVDRYGGETGIKNLEEYASKYWDLLKNAPRWISVKERLPKDGEFVLVCNDDKHMMIAKYETETYEWYYKYTNYDFDIWDNEEQGPVCYWMPLPEPPKEET